MSFASRPAHSCLVIGLALSVATAVAVRPGVASADAATDKREARKLFKKGRDLMRAGRFAEACPLFEQSLERYDGVGTRGKLAECYDKNQQVASAWRLYREVERLAGELGQSERADAARKRARALESRLSRLLVLADENRSLAELQVRHNGRIVPSQQVGIEMLVDAGSHHLHVEAPGHESWQGTVTLAEGEAKTVAVPKLVRRIRENRPRTVPSAWKRNTGLAILGLGAAAGLTAGYFGGRSYLDARGLGAPCRAERFLCSDEEIAANDSARTNATRANWAMLVSAPLLATGVAVWLLGRRDLRASRRERAVTLAPVLTDSAASLLLSGRF